MIYKLLVRLNDGICAVLKPAVMVFLFCLTILVVAGVVARSTGTSLAWTEGLIIYFFSWLTYIGAALVLRNRGHISVTVLLDRVPVTVRRILTVLGQLAILAFAITVITISSRMVLMFHRNDMRDMRIEWLRMAYVFLQVPVANCLFALFILEQILGQFFAPPAEEDKIGDYTAKG